uniref:C2H2-type domain-containing protein n=1 Tax=Ascaris lumbricoides TaxID=6252 RepID=A0A0M3I356_ASCLU
MLNLAFAFAQKELTKLHITVDDTLRTYTGPRVPVCNAVALYLKNHFSLKPCFSIYRRLCGIQIIDDYEGERKDRQNFKSTLRALKEKMLKMEQRPDFGSKEREELFGKELVFNMKYLKLTQLGQHVEAKDNALAVNADVEHNARPTKRKRSLKRIASPSPEVPLAVIKATLRQKRNAMHSAAHRPAMAKVRLARKRAATAHPEHQGSLVKRNRGRKPAAIAHPEGESSLVEKRGRKRIRGLPTQLKTESFLAKDAVKKAVAKISEARLPIDIKDITDEALMIRPPTKKRFVARGVKEESDSEVNKTIAVGLVGAKGHVKEAAHSLLVVSGETPGPSSVAKPQPFVSVALSAKQEENAEAIIPSIQNGRQALRREITTKPPVASLIKGLSLLAMHGAVALYCCIVALMYMVIVLQLEEKVKGMERAMKELEEDKRSCEAELEAVRQDLKKACAQIAHLSKVNAELSKQEVAIKRNGQYTDELKACLCHLKKAGVPDAKCGEVIITVGVLLGKKVVGEEPGTMNGK